MVLNWIRDQTSVLRVEQKLNKFNILERIVHHTGNLYQIFTYVENKELEMQGKDVEISGMPLYARATERIRLDSDYVMSGNRISVKNLDLNQDFETIKLQLDNLVEDYF